MSIFKEVKTDIDYLFPKSIRDYLSDDHKAWIFHDIFKTIDISSITKQYSSGGREANNPLSMIETIFYSSYQRIRSSRKIEEAMKEQKHDFVEQLFLSKQYRKNLRTLYAGTNINNLTNNDIKKMKFTIPKSKEERLKIGSILSTMDKEIELLNKKIKTYNQQKKGLMQKLLTGKIRVKV